MTHKEVRCGTSSLRELHRIETASRWTIMAHKRLAWQSTFARIHHLNDPKEIVYLGTVPESIQRNIHEHWPASVTGRTVLTGERRVHYLSRHPEIVRYESELMSALFDPDEVHSDKRDPQVGIWYRRFDQNHLLRVVVWISDNQNLQNSIHSLRLADGNELMRSRKQGHMLWARN